MFDTSSFPVRHLLAPLFAIVFSAGVLPAQTANAVESGLGPVAMWRGHTSVATQNVQTVGYTYRPPTSGSWSPVWIAAADMPQQPTLRIRKTFEVPEGATVRSALADVSADRIYRLWVNGVLVSRGPDDPGNDWDSDRWSQHWLYSQVDLAPYLRDGRNVIAAEVFSSGTLSNFTRRATGFAFRATIDAGAQQVRLVSGDDWKASVCGCYSEATLPGMKDDSDPGLMYDARKDKPGWQMPAFDDSAWGHAVTIESHWGTLNPSLIPPRMEAVYPALAVETHDAGITSGAPLNDPAQQVHLPGNGTFTVRYDTVIAGYLSMQIKASAGTVVTMLPMEVGDQPYFKRPLQLTLRDGLTTWESPGYDSYSMVRITVTNASGPVDFVSFRSIFASQPVTYAGSFDSSDPSMNALWNAVRWQTQISLQDHYLDSPNHQEPLPDPGDYLVESLQNDYAFNSQWITRQDIRKFAEILDNNAEVNFHTSYSMLWIQMLMEYYQYTGDAALLRELAPSVDRLLDHIATFQGPDGLLSEAPNYMFMDWIMLDGYNLHHPPAMIGMGYMTAYFYNALANGIRIDELTGNTARKQKYEQQRAQIKEAFNRELWDASAGLYRDGLPFHNHQKLYMWLQADRAGLVTHTPQVNTVAVLYGLAPQQRERPVLEKILAQPPLSVQPYFMYFVFDAESRTGLFNHYAWDQMQWWHLNLETRTFQEMWHDGDWSHAWGGTPLTQMSSRMLGVTPAQPGYAVVSIAPQVNGLDWAKGTVPTVKGPVTVEWKKTDGEFTMMVTTPEGMPAQVVLPFLDGPGASWTMDGAASTRKLLDAAAGTHTFVVKAATIVPTGTRQ